MVNSSSDEARAPLSLILFGPFEVRVAGELLAPLRSRKGYRLLALLTLRSTSEVERTWLAGMIWPDSEEEKAAANLRNTLKDLRGALGGAAGRLRSPTPRTLLLDLAGAEVDVIAFDQAIVKADSRSLEQAVALYRGALFEGWVEEWAFEERSSREQAYLAALESLAAQKQQQGELRDAERYLRRIVVLDPTQETAQRTLMALLAASGSYAGAFLAYQEHRRLLRRDLNVEPDPETTALFQQLRSEAQRRASPRGDPVSPLADRPTEETFTFLFTDIEGSTRLWERYPRAMKVALARHDDLLSQIIERHGGTIFKRMGGQFCAAFPTAPDALAAALVSQRTVSAETWGEIGPLRVRMVLHTGAVQLRDNDYFGRPLNRIARLLDLSYGGQILLSLCTQELVRDQLPEDVRLLDLGECLLKDLERPERIFQLLVPDLPQEFPPLITPPSHRSFPPHAPESKQVADRDEPSGSSRAAAPTGAIVGVPRVALLYKRNAQPDEQLLTLLENHLTERGYQIFIDRHLTVGVAWAKEIEREVRAADAVIPLLSAAAVESEMLHYEIEIAHQAAQQHEGKPRILPVRVNYLGPLPDPLAVILSPLQYMLWEGPQDDQLLIEKLNHSLETPLTLPPVVPPGKWEPVGGAVNLTSPFYVVRPTDGEFQTAMERQDGVVLVKGARQMGKTSLLARGLQRARQHGAKVVLTDFQLLSAAHLESAEPLLFALAEWLAEKLDLDVPPDEVWTSRRGPSRNFTRYLEREVLGKITGPIVWGLDEVDRLVSREYASEVFGLFRALYNARVNEPHMGWSRLTLVIAYATEEHLLIRDLNQSPFNVGTRLLLEDFTLEQVADLNARHGSPLRDEMEVARFYRLVGGQPFLVRRGLLEMAAHGLEFGPLEAHADRADGIFGDHLRRMLVVLSQNAELCDVVREVLRGQPCPTEDSFYRLRTAGVIAGESAREVHLRCQLYATYLERHLL